MIICKTWIISPLPPSIEEPGLERQIAAVHTGGWFDEGFIWTEAVHGTQVAMEADNCVILVGEEEEEVSIETKRSQFKQWFTAWLR